MHDLNRVYPNIRLNNKYLGHHVLIHKHCRGYFIALHSAAFGVGRFKCWLLSPYCCYVVINNPTQLVYKLNM